MANHRLFFVSSNEEKYREIRGALASCAVEIERVPLDLPEIQAIDPVAVAAYKARKAYERLGEGQVLVEDTGLGIVEWQGYPGALIKWVLQAVGEAGLCRQLNDWEDRRALATVVLCLFDGGALHTFAGQAEGEITLYPRGTHGFGWDSIFLPRGASMTYGEMPREEKMKNSMRTRALRQLQHHLASMADT